MNILTVLTVIYCCFSSSDKCTYAGHFRLKRLLNVLTVNVNVTYKLASVTLCMCVPTHTCVCEYISPSGALTRTEYSCSSIIEGSSKPDHLHRAEQPNNEMGIH